MYLLSKKAEHEKSSVTMGHCIFYLYIINSMFNRDQQISDAQNSLLDCVKKYQVKNTLEIAMVKVQFRTETYCQKLTQKHFFLPNGLVSPRGS